MNNFGVKQSTLDLNGPIVRFIQQPESKTISNSGIATFIGIATAFFPNQTPENPVTNSGVLSYQWYEQTLGPLSDGISVALGATITGSATTTLTVSEVTTPNTNNSRFFLRADYIPSAYSQPVGVPVTVGTARSTGNAINEPADSDVAVLSVLPIITITAQPVDDTSGTNGQANFSVGATLSDSFYGGLSYQWQLNGQNLDDNPDVTNFIIGSKTESLVLSPSTSGVSTVRVVLSNPFAETVYSDVVNLNVVNPRSILVLEGFDFNTAEARLEANLDNGSYTLNSGVFGQDINTISFHAGEKNIDLELEMYASRGQNNGSFVGGAGGYSKLRFTMQKNDEYTVVGINNNSALFLYRKSKLIAVVGKGGDAGTSSNGGSGGGVNRAGGSGAGKNAGSGGSLISSGQLNTTGIFGSSSTPRDLLPGDTKAESPNGGRTISCPKGQYWLNLGKSPCEDLGITQFYSSVGDLASSSARISRGFKQGYSVTDTAGLGIRDGGNGGNGATGGNGGTDGAGGGGGSGYSDGSVTTLESSSGTNSNPGSSMVFRIYVPPPPAPPPPPPTPPPPPPPPRGPIDGNGREGVLFEIVSNTGGTVRAFQDGSFGGYTLNSGRNVVYLSQGASYSFFNVGNDFRIRRL